MDPDDRVDDPNDVADDDFLEFLKSLEEICVNDPKGKPSGAPKKKKRKKKR